MRISGPIFATWVKLGFQIAYTDLGKRTSRFLNCQHWVAGRQRLEAEMGEPLTAEIIVHDIARGGRLDTSLTMGSSSSPCQIERYGHRYLGI